MSTDINIGFVADIVHLALDEGGPPMVANMTPGEAEEVALELLRAATRARDLMESTSSSA